MIVVRLEPNNIVQQPLTSVHKRRSSVSAERFLVRSKHIVRCTRLCATLSAVECNVVRSRVQRCPRPWTTLYTASCDGKKDLRYGEVPCRYRGRAAETYKMRHGCRRWHAGVNKKDAVRKRPAYMSILQPTCAYVFTRHQPDASSFSHAKPCRA